jgi:TonB family protein
MPARRVVTIAAFTLLAGCGLNPIVVGPPDLDTASAAAPICTAQQYPNDALVASESGTVVVKVHVSSTGHIASSSIEMPAFNHFLNAAALMAMDYCRFRPSTEGKERIVRVTVVYDFVGRKDILPVGVVKIGVQPSLQTGA